MLVATVLLMLWDTNSRTVDATDRDFDKTLRVITDAWTDNCIPYKKLNGVVTSIVLDKDNIPNKVKNVIIFDGFNSLNALYLNGSEFRGAGISRNFNGVQQLLGINISGQTKKPVIQSESYSTSIDYYDVFITKDDRTFMKTWGTGAPFRPTSHLRLSLLDLLEYPAFKVKTIRKNVDGEAKNVQIDYEVDQVINEKQVNPNKLFGLKEGSVILRPDMNWMIIKSLYVIDSKKTTRKWQSDYDYDINPNQVPIIKSIKTHTIDNNPDAKLLPLEISSEFQLEIVDHKLPAEVFSLKQFGLEERTPEDYERMIAMQKEAELKEKNTFAPTPPGGFPVAAQPFMISPWWWLTGAGVALVLLSAFLLRYAKRKPMV